MIFVELSVLHTNTSVRLHCAFNQHELVPQAAFAGVTPTGLMLDEYHHSSAPKRQNKRRVKDLIERPRILG